jgi:hypothetical protein
VPYLDKVVAYAGASYWRAWRCAARRGRAGVNGGIMPPLTPGRLRKPAGLPPLTQATTYAVAAVVFAHEGEDPRGKDPDALREAWLRLQRRYHEAGTSPDPAKLADINAAYGVLKDGPGAADAGGGQPAPAPMAQARPDWGIPPDHQDRLQAMRDRINAAGHRPEKRGFLEGFFRKVFGR